MKCKRSFLLFLLVFILGIIDMSGQETENRTSDFIYKLNRDKNAVIITDYIGKKTDVSVPEKIDGYPVVAFDLDFRHNFHNITSIVFPDTIISLGDQIFPPLSSKLKKVVLPKYITRIPDDMFQGCQNLTEIIWPENLEEIGERAFYNMRSPNMTAIVLPKTVKKIGRQAFYLCTNVKSVELPEELEYIENQAFYSCNQLESVKTYQKILYIGDEAFSYCLNLKTFNTPDKKIDYGYGVFIGCAKLNSEDQSKITNSGYNGEF